MQNLGSSASKIEANECEIHFYWAGIITPKSQKDLRICGKCENSSKIAFEPVPKPYFPVYQALAHFWDTEGS